MRVGVKGSFSDWTVTMNGVPQGFSPYNPVIYYISLIRHARMDRKLVVFVRI